MKYSAIPSAVFAFFILFVLFSFLMPGFATPVLADVAAPATNETTVYLFYAKYCTFCEKEQKFLGTLEQKYPGLIVKSFESSYNASNADLFRNMSQAYGSAYGYFPTIFIGDFDPIIGYYNDETTGKAIEDNIAYCLSAGCIDPIEKLNPHPQQNQTEVVELPIFGMVDVAQVGMLAFTVMVGVLDGFNPCAMWVLVFLLSMLLSVGDRKRVFIIGGAFLLVSGLVYFAFMVAWLNLFLFAGYMSIVTYAVGALAIAFGIMNIKDFFTEKLCRTSLVIPGTKFNIFSKLQKVVSAKVPLYVMLAWVMFLAVGVNFVELVCTAGFPAVYTKILAMQALPALMCYGYLFVYILLYMADDLLLFSIVVYTMSSEKFTQKYGRASKFISGCVILALGIIIIVNPGLLMFG